jgi:hypothetical protein
MGGGISTEADGGYMKVGVNDIDGRERRGKFQSFLKKEGQESRHLSLSPSLVIDACS